MKTKTVKQTIIKSVIENNIAGLFCANKHYNDNIKQSIIENHYCINVDNDYWYENIIAELQEFFQLIGFKNAKIDFALSFSQSDYAGLSASFYADNVNIEKAKKEYQYLYSKFEFNIDTLQELLDNFNKEHNGEYDLDFTVKLHGYYNNSVSIDIDNAYFTIDLETSIEGIITSINRQIYNIMHDHYDLLTSTESILETYFVMENDVVNKVDINNLSRIIESKLLSVGIKPVFNNLDIEELVYYPLHYHNLMHLTYDDVFIKQLVVHGLFANNMYYNEKVNDLLTLANHVSYYVSFKYNNETNAFTPYSYNLNGETYLFEDTYTISMFGLIHDIYELRENFRLNDDEYLKYKD